ncbi:hypothetical protein OH77DRAFT_1525930 [Trametes cingulata]|nr:hypothetical protein OH77DRAFT_1525930 [Trametes cingulata]
MMFRIAEQILGRKDSQENGTCATIFPLYRDAREEDMQTSDLLESFSSAPPLAAKDIRHTPAEADLFHESLEHAALRDLVSRTELFARFRPQVDACLPGKYEQIPIHQTEVHALPAMNIDESSITGNADVVDSMFKELGFDVGTTKFSGILRPIFGDQLSIARLRSLITNRAGHEGSAHSYSHLVFGPGFFHHQMALTHGIIETHWGDTHAGTRSPGSLSFLNTVLDRKPIVLTSLPPYRTCRDLIFTTLSASLLHCLELVTKCESLEDYARTVSFTQLRADVSKIMDRFVSPNTVATLRNNRANEVARLQLPRPVLPFEGGHASLTITTVPQASVPHPTAPPASLNEAASVPKTSVSVCTGVQAHDLQLTVGDVVHENMCLFLRDALVLREFTDAIKGVSSGRILRVLKLLALMYRGSGRMKYAHELLHLVHNLTHIWPKPLRDVMIKNWLVNPSGKPNSWVPVDLLQEHINFWIKVIYKAQGGNASWEWLEMISPTIYDLPPTPRSGNDV